METDQLNQICDGKDWFNGIDVDTAGRYIVYANFINAEVFQTVPSTLNSKQVLIHFASNKNAKAEQFAFDPNAPTEVIDMDDISISSLISSLDCLKKEYGSFVLETIFFEIHDGDDAITSLSPSYPVARNEMQKLYDQFGFDVLFSEFETAPEGQ